MNYLLKNGLIVYIPKTYMETDSKVIQKKIAEQYKNLKWRKEPIQNGCEQKIKKNKPDEKLNFHNSQLFLKDYFTPKNLSKGMIINHSVGSGKCHSFNTPILMANGEIKKVQNIKVGEKLMGDDSKPRKVLSLGRGKDTMYEIKPVKGESFTVNSEHILCLKVTNRGVKYISKNKKKKYCAVYLDKETIKYKSKYFETKKEGEDYIKTKIKKEEDKIVELSINDFLELPKSTQKELKLYRKGVDFKIKKVDFDPYIIGFWIGDGSKKDTCIANQDATVLKYLKETLPKYDLYLQYHKNYDYRINSLNKGGNQHTGNTNRFMKELKKQNLINNKHIPDIYKINSREVRLQVLAGLIDSDGHYDKKGGYSIVQKLEIIADDIVFLCRSLGFAAYKKEKKTSWAYKGVKKYGKVYNVSISGDIDEVPVKIKRKIASSRKQKKDVLVTGFKVIEKSIDNYYGFTIDRNNRYLMGDFTVTHNTCSAVAMGSTFDKKNYKILWVTQHKLKNDMWKNILGQFSCHEGYRNFQEKMKIPDDYDKQKKIFNKITKKAWYPPITYKQFSNLLLKKNQMGIDFYTRNEIDPLERVLVIIDESHNLFNKSLPEHQKPNMSIIKKKIYESYNLSKEKSVKLILLTATPLLDDVMSYFKLINLIIPLKRNRFSTDLKIFSQKYLKDNKFSDRGLQLFNKNSSRLVSLLDLSKNINKFAQPVILEKSSMIEEITDGDLKEEIKELRKENTDLENNIKLEMNFDFKNQKELINYIKNNNEENMNDKINMFLENPISKEQIILFKKNKPDKEDKIIIKEIKDNIQNTFQNKNEILKNLKKIKKEEINKKIKNKKELLETNIGKLDYQIKKCQIENKDNINKNIKCLQKKDLWNSDKDLSKQFRFENKNFKKELLKNNIKKHSDKIDLLFQNIDRIDKKTLEKNGKLYKHIIYVHNNGYQGMKLLISCMIAKNYNFLLKKENNKLIIEEKNSSQNFLTLTSGDIYDKSFNKKITKQINNLYNERPHNINGEKCRFILIDYNYKEGIDLYDVKYFHILDSYLFETEMQQLIGRGTRNCGQSGLPFNKGWKLLTYLYYNKYDKKRSIEDIIKNLRAKKIGITELDLKIRHVIKTNIRKNAIDELLTKNILPIS